MTLPVVAITNASTCLTDEQVAAALPALQRQVSLDFRSYWGVDCQLTSLPKGAALIDGWWQISVTDNPDQAGALCYHELTSTGTPLGKVFAGLDLQSGASWTVTLSHELREMLADPWINWCAQGPDGKVYALEVCDAVEADALGYEIDGVLVSDFITPSWFEPTRAAGWISSDALPSRSNWLRAATSRFWMRVVVGHRSRRKASMSIKFHWEAEGSGAT